MVECDKLGGMRRATFGIIIAITFWLTPTATFAVDITLIQLDRDMALQEAAVNADLAASWDYSLDEEAKNQQRKYRQRFEYAMERVRQYDIEIAKWEQANGGKPTIQTTKERQATQRYFDQKNYIENVRRTSSNPAIEPLLAEREVSAMKQFAKTNENINNPSRPPKPDPFLEKPYTPPKKTIGFNPNEAQDLMLSPGEKNLKSPKEPLNLNSNNPDNQTTRVKLRRSPKLKTKITPEYVQAKRAQINSFNPHTPLITPNQTRLKAVMALFQKIVTVGAVVDGLGHIFIDNPLSYAQITYRINSNYDLLRELRDPANEASLTGENMILIDQYKEIWEETQRLEAEKKRMDKADEEKLKNMTNQQIINEISREQGIL